MNSKVLIHVGLQKTGTTWLQHWMHAHPSIAYRLDSFGGVQRPVDICRTAMAASPRWYAISDENLTGGLAWPEGYTNLLMRHEGFDRQPTGLLEHRTRVADQLHAMFPHATILITTRGFSGALRSLYAQVVRFGGDQPFETFVKTYANFITDWFDYNSVVEMYRARFGNVLLLPYEVLAEDQPRYERLLEEYLDLPPATVQIGRVYPSLNARQQVAYSRCSRILLRPLVDRISWHRAHTLYLAYAAWIVDRSWCDGLIQCLFAPGRHHPAIEVPGEMLEQFRGKASLLMNEPVYAPYMAEYLN